MGFKLIMDDGVSEEDDRREAERWARMTPEQRKRAEDEAYGAPGAAAQEPEK